MAYQAPAPAEAQLAPPADASQTTHQPTAPQASKGIRNPDALMLEGAAEEQAVEWCDACHFWRPRPCGQCPPRPNSLATNETIAEYALGGGPASEAAHDDRPYAAPPALDAEAPRIIASLQPSPIDVDAS